MTKYEKKHGFITIIKDGLDSISKILSVGIFPQIAEGAERIINHIEDKKIMQIKKRILQEITSFLIIGLGGIFLIFALFFFLKEFLGWNNAITFFSIGITIFVIGLLLKIRESKRK